MIRVLVMIAVSGFVLALATITAAVAIGGPDALTHGGWQWAGNHWGWDDDDWDHDRGDRGRRAEATRTIPWDGGDRLELEIPADVRYIQTPGPGSVTVTGREFAVEHVVVEDGRIRFDGSRRMRRLIRGLDIVIRAPSVTDFEINGRNDLTIEDYKQERLRIHISGSGEVTARGETSNLELNVSGSGEADLAGLATKVAVVDINGSGEAIVAPTEQARLEISGNGDVTLTTNPKQVQTDVSGSGDIHYASPASGGEPSVSPSPTPSPSPSPSPTPKGAKL